MKRKLLTTTLSLLAVGAILTGCGTNSGAGNEQDSAGTAQDVAVKKINIATGATGAPYTFVDEKGNLAGYDVEVANEVDKRTPEFEFVWNKTEFASIFLGLDSGRYQVAVNNIVKKPERLEKYLFSDNGYLVNKNVIVVQNDNTSIHSFDDLAGKKVATFSNGSAPQLFLEDYNANHANAPMDLVHSGASVSEILNGVNQGLYDATYTVAPTVDEYNKANAGNLKKIDLPADIQEQVNLKGYFVFSKDQEDTKQLVDKALQSMIEDGTLSELSNKWFAEDYSK